jgi:hypothetical protein
LQNRLANQTENRYRNRAEIMVSFPLPETIRDNLVLSLPKLLIGEVVKSEITDDPNREPSFWEERIKEIVAILQIEPKERTWTDDERTVRQAFECTIEAERWVFSWEAARGEDLRIPPRKEWEWTSEGDRYYLVNLDVEMNASQDGRLVFDEITVFDIKPIFEFGFLAEHSYGHVGSELKKLKRPVFGPGPFGIFVD